MRSEEREQPDWRNPWRLVFASSVDRATRRRAIKLVLILETCYVIATVIALVAIPKKPLESNTGLILLGTGVVVLTGTLVYFARRRS